MTIDLANLATSLFITFLFCSVFILGVCAMAYSAVSQVMRTADSYFAVLDSQSQPTPATSPS